MSLTLVTAPAVEPITLAEAKLHCGIGDGQIASDSLLTSFMIPGARDRAELATQRQFIRATWEWRLDDFSCARWIELPRPPLVSITSLTYYDTSGVLQTWAGTNYYAITPQGPRGGRGRLVLADTVSWPTVQCRPEAVVIKFVAGYGTTPATVPPLLRMAMLQDIATLYAFRERIIAAQGLTGAIEIPGYSNDIYRSFRSHPRW